MTERTKPKSNGNGMIKRPQRLADEVYSILYSKLMSLEIEPGNRIMIDALVKELGVSQTPIREALSRLEAQGLVVQTHLIGYSAASQLEHDKLEKLFDMRLLLEPYAAENAAKLISDEGVERLKCIDAVMQGTESRELRGKFLDFAQSDGQLHDLISSSSGNELVHDALARLHTHIHLFRLLYLPSATTDVNAEHAEIVDAVSRRDGKRAFKAMKFHIEQSRRRFLEQVSKSDSE
ncbi:GntR family transcriptional regulator [Sinorhizobium sp. GL28]|uniref:GntR family transcriptional regulator n=1 Tax=Sinorhizobium sp. GL28 TaxID=1358418 RepID=UPI00071D694C|nr:GntR family transcriptional regulator [Sinorhizobium sp. GL28]